MTSRSLWSTDSIDFIVAVFSCWHLPQLCWLTEAMKECIKRQPTDGHVCNIEHAQQLAVPLMNMSNVSVTTLETALAILSEDSKQWLTVTDERSLVNSRICIVNIRALFLIGFTFDFRIRALVMAHVSPIHAAFKTRPPSIERLKKMFDNGFGELASGFLNDVLHFRESQQERAHLQVIDCADDMGEFVSKWYIRSELPIV